eukprot:1471389-Pyramimonas_sp.AAC.1
MCRDLRRAVYSRSRGVRSSPPSGVTITAEQKRAPSIRVRTRRTCTRRFPAPLPSASGPALDLRGALSRFAYQRKRTR